jgi:hypothetical protein
VTALRIQKGHDVVFSDGNLPDVVQQGNLSCGNPRNLESRDNSIVRDFKELNIIPPTRSL